MPSSRVCLCLSPTSGCYTKTAKRRITLTTPQRILVFCFQIKFERNHPQRGRQIQHTHPFNGPFSWTTQVSRYQKGKTNLDFTEARDSEWQWHQLDHMQICTLLQTDNHTSTPPLCFYRPDALPAAQPTASKH